MKTLLTLSGTTLNIDGYCEEWSEWSGFALIDYIFYLVFAVGQHLYLKVKS
jgi:hypothetical protein